MAKIPPAIQPFLETLEDLHALFKELKVSYVLIGGLSVSLISEPRLTRDIDALVDLSDQQLEALFRRCREFRFGPRLSNALEFAQRRHVLLFKHQKSRIDLDLSRAFLPFQKELLRRAKKIRVGPLNLKIPTPEDLIITKAVAHRPQDLADIAAILNVHPKLNLKRVRNWVRQFASVLEMPEMLSDLEKLLRPSKRRS